MIFSIRRDADFHFAFVISLIALILSERFSPPPLPHTRLTVRPTPSAATFATVFTVTTRTSHVTPFSSPFRRAAGTPRRYAEADVFAAAVCAAS